MLLGNTHEILEKHISGFHQYILDAPVHLHYAGESLCAMVGLTSEELTATDHDAYEALVHPNDRHIYTDLIHRLKEREQSVTAEYRLICSNGDVRYVSDTATSLRLENGTKIAHSVLTDITPLKAENDNLHFLNETIPCGFIRYTCDPNPRVTYINDRMKQFLHFPPGESAYADRYKDNIFLMIPMEDHRRFSRFLRHVYTKGTPLAGEMTFLRCDGTKARLFGWVTKYTDQNGNTEFQSVCMDVTERYQRRKASERKRWLNALTKVYDTIFEYDFTAGTVQCLYGQRSDTFRGLQNIPMQFEDATERWIRSAVHQNDCETVRRFFGRLFHPDQHPEDDLPPQIRYHALSSDGRIRPYAGIVLKIDTSVSYFCCRRLEEEPTSASPPAMRELVMREFATHFSEGVVAFEVESDTVKPLYASDNVCRFFGYTKDEWDDMSKTPHSIRDFVSQSGVDYAVFADLLRSGEAEFDYFDICSGTTRRIKAVCSKAFSDDPHKQYVMLYNVGSRSNDREADEAPRVYIRTFGYFDVFVDGKPIAFRNEKSKELFALLVDRRGGYVSSEEAIGFLWEDESANTVTLARYRKVALRLKNLLEEYGISSIVESVNGRRRLVTDRVQCDLYDYLSGKEEFSQLFKGSYLTNYSWGELTLGELQGSIL